MDLNQGPLDLQSDALSTELSGPGGNPFQSLRIYLSKIEKSKANTINLFVKIFSKAQDFEPGALGSAANALSGLGRILCKSMEIYFSIKENIVPHVFFLLSFPFLGHVSYTLASLGKGNCPLKIDSHLVETFSTGRKCRSCEKYIFQIFILANVLNLISPTYGVEDRKQT